MSHSQSRWLVPVLLLAGLACNLYAVDGVVLIDQNRALAGSVTPGDTPGFPVTLSLPGSYRLDGNLTVPNANTTAIRIAANNVTIDLNGFSIIGPIVCPGARCIAGTGNGIDSFDAYNTASIRNGSVRGMGSDGISLAGVAFSTVEKVRVSSNGQDGIEGTVSTLSGNTVENNGATGIQCSRCTITGNLVYANGANGIFGTQSTIIGNTVTSNQGTGMIINCPSSVVNNTATGNPTNLTLTGPGCAAANNAAP